MRPWTGVLAAWAFLLLGLAPAVAATESPDRFPSDKPDISYSAWSVQGSTVRLRFVLPERDREVLAPRSSRADAAAVGETVAANVEVASSGGSCIQIDQGEGAGQVYDLALTPGLLRYEIIFDCPTSDHITLSDHVLFAQRAAHVNYARVQAGAGKAVVELFTKGRQSISLSATGRTPLGPRLVEAVKTGFWPPRPQRLCLALALLLLVRRRRDLLAGAGALAAGYGAAVLLGAWGMTTPSLDLNFALAALTLALLGICVMRLDAAGRAWPRAWRIAITAILVLVAIGLPAFTALRNAPAGLATAGLIVFGAAACWLAGVAPRFRWIDFTPVAIFCMLDGVRPVAGLAALSRSQEPVAALMAAQDLGAMAAILIPVSAVVAALWMIRRRRPIAMAAASMDLGAAGLIGVGLYWFASRAWA